MHGVFFFFFTKYVLQYYMLHDWLDPPSWNHRYRGPTMGLEYPWILVSNVGLGTNPPTDTEGIL